MLFIVTSAVYLCRSSHLDYFILRQIILGNKYFKNIPVVIYYLLNSREIYKFKYKEI